MRHRYGIASRVCDDINNSTGLARKKIVLTLVKQRQNFAKAFITVVMGVTCILKNKDLQT